MSEILDHNADGITEFDNPVPAWLAWLFYLTILFAVGYCVVYPSFWFWPGTSRWVSTAEADRRAAQTAQTGKAQAAVPTDLDAMARDEKTRTAGHAIYLTHCATCHGMEAEGKIGPSLTDKEWKFGDKPEDILTSIRGGRPAGMPAWASVLKPDELNQVAAYVYSLRVSHDQALR
ncbi:MAG: cbb3-type cytochrome c oxidase N-terminal domain-containing protein [Candidatus Eremiobacterota bacterium]